MQNEKSDTEDNSLTPPTLISRDRKIIEPSAELTSQIKAEKKQHNPVATSPNRTNIQTQFSNNPPSAPVNSEIENLSTSQQYALASIRLRTKEANRLVSMRVKSLLIVATIGAIGGVYGLVESFTAPTYSYFVGIFALISLIQLSASVYLFIGKNHNTVALLIKIFIVFQLIGLFFSLMNPRAFLLNGAVVLYLFYVYSRVKSLSYY